MAGLSSWLRTACAALAGAVGLAGCNTMETLAPSDADCGPDGCAAKQTCFDGHCDHAGGGLSAKFDKLKRQIENFDTEQLHPDHCWPEQYSREAMRRVNAPFGQQVKNGNAVEMTVWEHYFQLDDEGKPTDQLNEAGRRRIQYFARRKPYVIPSMQLQTSFDKELDAKRVQSLVASANRFSIEPIPWQVSIVDRAVTGLYGPEGPKVITKMVGPGAGPPAYERNIKATFLSGPQTGSTGTGS